MGIPSKKITDKKLYLQFSDRFATSDERKEYYRINKPKKNTDGFVYYDTLKHQFWIETTEKPHRKDGHLPLPYEEWLNTDLKGNIIAVKHRDSIKTSPGIILEDEIVNFYKWNDKNQKFYMDYFFREKFNWSAMNPVRGIGFSNGASSHTWQGTAFFRLLMDAQPIEFKINTANTASFEMRLYRLPRHFTEKETALLYVADKYFDQKETGLYLMTKN